MAKIGSEASSTVEEKTQRERFRKWYVENKGTYNTATQYATALGRTKLKDGKAIFAIADYDELFGAIENTNLAEYFKASDGDYSKMEAVFEFEPAVQTDDLKGGIKFYLEFLKSGGQPVARSGSDEESQIIFNKHLLQKALEKYKEIFISRRWGEENYKWVAIKVFQDNWDINAPDFASMLSNSLSETKNLLTTGNYYPLKMINYYAGKDPEQVRMMFTELFDESQDVFSRVSAFKNYAKKLESLYSETGKQHFQDARAISTYLWLRYPDKYYIFKFTEMNAVAERLESNLKFKRGSDIDNLRKCFRLYDELCEEIEEDKDLIAMFKSQLSNDCYPDPEYKTLAGDVGYFITQAYFDFTGEVASPEAPVKAVKSHSSYKGEKNIILYGAPGTGKTYSSIQHAVSILEEKTIHEIKAEDYAEVRRRFLSYKDDGLVAFTTFHQSFSYEEFIEGIRPVILSEDSTGATSEIEYEIHSGLFKLFCDKAGTPRNSGESDDLGINKNPKVWKVSLQGTGENPTRTECMENGHIRIGWDEYGEFVTDATDYSEFGGQIILNAFNNVMSIGDIVLSCYSSKTIDAIGVITGDPEWHDEFADYKRVRNVKWLIKGINEDIVDLNGGKQMTVGTAYKLSITVSDVLRLLSELNPTLLAKSVKIPKRVFIIDEINRGNISKIFGELITLIEPSKRLGEEEELRVTLPYSALPFGVPSNVYIIGTMNTADRSIALIDTALRRRFSFVEVAPDPSTLNGVSVGEINIEKMLETLNRRIAALYDREHTIGHAYLLPLKEDTSIENLAGIFENKIIPLLQEYFYDDYEKIQLVLGDNQKDDDDTRFIVKNSDTGELFGGADVDVLESYQVNHDAFKSSDAYAYLQ